MEDFMIGIAKQQGSDLFESAKYGFDLSLEMVGEDVLVNGVTTSVILKNKENSDTEKLIAANIDNLQLGDFIFYKGKSWLLVFLQESGVYLKGIMKLCNSTFKVQIDKTRVLLGYDSRNLPEYEYEIITEDRPCIAESRTFSNYKDTELPLPNGQIRITMKYELAENLKVNSKFTMYGNQYEIIDIDYTRVVNEQGVMYLICERSV